MVTWENDLLIKKYKNRTGYNCNTKVNIIKRNKKVPVITKNNNSIVRNNTQKIKLKQW